MSGAEDVPVEEEQRRERLGLRGGADLVHDREMGEEGVDLGRPHLGRVPELVEPDEATHPQAVGLLGAPAVVARTDRLVELVHETRRAVSSDEAERRPLARFWGHRLIFARVGAGSTGACERHSGDE